MWQPGFAIDIYSIIMIDFVTENFSSGNKQVVKLLAYISDKDLFAEFYR